VGSCPAAIPPEPLPSYLLQMNGDSDPTDGPQVLAQVVLAKKRGTAIYYICQSVRLILNLCIVFSHRIPTFPPPTCQFNPLPSTAHPCSPFSLRSTVSSLSIIRIEVPLGQCPNFRGRVSIFKSAITMFYAPSDQSGVGGMNPSANPSYKKMASRSSSLRLVYLFRRMPILRACGTWFSHNLPITL